MSCSGESEARWRGAVPLGAAIRTFQRGTPARAGGKSCSWSGGCPGAPVCKNAFNRKGVSDRFPPRRGRAGSSFQENLFPGTSETQAGWDRRDKTALAIGGDSFF